MAEALRGLVLMLFLSVPTWTASAITCTWTAAGGGDWTNGANWAGGVPGPSDEALFNSGSAAVTVTVAVAVDKLTITNCTRTLTFVQGVAADLTLGNDLYVGTGSVIQCPYTSTNGNGTGRVITVFGNAVINGTINADGCGFPAGGYGPGYDGAYHSGAHGGIANSKPTYGSVTNPTSLGSSSDNRSGGGAIKLDVSGGTLTLNGAITARGIGGDYPPAGGSVWLIANTLAGNGSIRADAGSGSAGGTYGGGGGRVAILYTTSSFSGMVSVAGSAYASGLGTAQPGTLWEPKRFVGLEGSAGSPQDITITNSYQYYPPDTNSAYYWNLTVNGAWFELHSNSLCLSDFLLTNGATVRFDRALGGTGKFDLQALAATNSITVANGSKLYLPAEGAYTLARDFYVETNATVYIFGNTGAVNTASGGTPASPHGVGVTLACRNATIRGTVNADGGGFIYGGPGQHSVPGYEAGYGGWGVFSGVRYGPSYGQLTRPTALGSSGYNSISSGNTGGGAVKLVASGTLLLDGLITANVNPGASYSGSGGSVWLTAGGDFSGSGQIRANSKNVDAGGTGGGGGGRIVIEYGASTFSGTTTVTRGIGAAANSTGEYGTVCSLQLPVSGAIASTYSVTSNSNGVRIVRTRLPGGGRSFHWMESCTDLVNSNQLDNVATYDLSGLKPATRYSIFTNDILMTVTNSDVSGGISNIVVSLSGGPATVFIVGPAGAVFIVH